MKDFCTDNPCRGQTALEYLLLMAVVAVVVIASFKPGSLISQVHDASQGYYNTVTRVIMGVGSDAKPAKINGGWCSVTCPAGGINNFQNIYSVCGCPQPAFGGDYCPGVGTTVTCPAGGTSGTSACPLGAEIICTGSINFAVGTRLAFSARARDAISSTTAEQW